MISVLELKPREAEKLGKDKNKGNLGITGSASVIDELKFLPLLRFIYKLVNLYLLVKLDTSQL